MRKWPSIIPNSPMLSIYLWIIFCFLPFFFIFRKSSYIEISVGITFLMLYFIFYRFSMNSKNGLVYMWISFEMVINIVMTILYGYVYLSIFTAFLLEIFVNLLVSILCMDYILALRLSLQVLAFSLSYTYFYHNYHLLF